MISVPNIRAVVMIKKAGAGFRDLAHQGDHLKPDSNVQTDTEWKQGEAPNVPEE